MQKYFDNVTNRNGDAVPALVTVTVTASGSLATIYSDDGVTTKGNPITCDNNGYYEFFAANGKYTLAFSGTGITGASISNVLLEDLSGSSVYNPASVAITGGAIVGATLGGVPAVDVARFSTSSEQNVITVKPWGLPIGTATTLGQTWAIGINSPVAFDAIQIGYMHVGGFGDCTGIKAVVAGTDDIGPCNFAAGGADLTFKKFVTPWVAGSEFNVLGSPGWKAVTWSGASSASVTDPGANLIGIAWSDVIQLPSYLDARNATGWYSALIRIYPGAGACTYGGKPGWTTGTQYNSELGPAKMVGAIRSGDQVTDPTLWTKALTATITDTPTTPIVVRFIGANPASKTGMFVGDSRFDTVTEAAFATTQGYRSFSYMMEAKLNAAGLKRRIIKTGIGGATSATYYQHGTQMLQVCAPNWAVYLGYTINDGTPTDAIMQTARYRTLLFVQRCKTLGVVPIIVSAYPRGGMTAGDMVFLNAFEAWVATLGVLWFSPLQRYGNADGTWKTGVSTDGTNHMTQAAYSQMGDDFLAFAASVL